LKKGGLVVWVSLANDDAENRAVTALKKMGAEHVHVHEISREWRLSDLPLGAAVAAQPDPFLESDRLAVKGGPISSIVKKRGDRRPSPAARSRRK
jgi:hypothetical protein